MSAFALNDTIHGFAGGYFGRDSYACRTVVAVGPDWVVTRNEQSEVEFAKGDLTRVHSASEDRLGCYCEPGQPTTPPPGIPCPDCKGTGRLPGV